MSNESMFSEEEINLMKAGKSVSKSVSYGGNPKPESHQINVVNAGTGSVSTSWGKAPVVTGIGTQRVTPRVRNEDGSINNQSIVRQPDISKFNHLDDERRAAKREAELERAEHLQLISPEALMKRLDTQNRLIKKLEKQIKLIQESINKTNAT